MSETAILFCIVERPSKLVSGVSFCLLGILLVLTLPVPLRADGGEVRFSQRLGDYQVTVFTAPVPLRAGPVDVSVFVQDAADNIPLLDTTVLVGMTPAGSTSGGIHQRASQEAATNKLYQSAKFELPHAGRWSVQIEIDGPHGPVHTQFDVEAAEPLPRWWDMVFWIALPVVPIVLFSVQQILTRRGRYSGTV
ncbi:MAG: hypothetical protein ACK4RK_13720 [Gemmataceae bacterium]